MPLGAEVGVGPRDIMLDGDPAPPQRKGTQQPSPHFGPFCSVTVAHVSNCWTLVDLCHDDVARDAVVLWIHLSDVFRYFYETEMFSVKVVLIQKNIRIFRRFVSRPTDSRATMT